jgi:hypothetical protein
MSEQRAMTLLNLLRGLHLEILQQLARPDQQQLANLSTTFAELIKVVEQFGDHELAHLLYDMSYAVTHALMGVPFKAQAVVPDIETQLRVLADRRA